MNASTQARAQFIEDYLLVIENDRNGYDEARRVIADSENTIEAGEALRDEFETWIQELADKEDERGNETGALLIKQLLQGWGSDTFYHIAKQLSEKE